MVHETECRSFREVDSQVAVEIVEEFIASYWSYTEQNGRKDSKSIHIDPDYFEVHLAILFGLKESERKKFCKLFSRSKKCLATSNSCNDQKAVWRNACRICFHEITGIVKDGCVTKGNKDYFRISSKNLPGNSKQESRTGESVDPKNGEWFRNKRFRQFIQEQKKIRNMMQNIWGKDVLLPKMNDENDDPNKAGNESHGKVPECTQEPVHEDALQEIGTCDEGGGSTCSNCDARSLSNLNDLTMSCSYSPTDHTILLHLANERVGLSQIRCHRCKNTGIAECRLGKPRGMDQPLEYYCRICDIPLIDAPAIHTSGVTEKVPVPKEDVGNIPVVIDQPNHRTVQDLDDWFEVKGGNSKPRHINVVFAAALFGTDTGYTRATKFLKEMGMTVPHPDTVAKITDTLHLATMIQSQTDFAIARSVFAERYGKAGCLKLTLKKQFWKQYPRIARSHGLVEVPHIPCLSCDGCGSHRCYCNRAKSACHAVAIVAGTPGQSRQWLVLDENIQQNRCCRCPLGKVAEHSGMCYKNSSLSAACCETDSMKMMGFMSLHPSRVHNGDSPYWSDVFSMDGDSRGVMAYYAGVRQVLLEYYEIDEVHIRKLISNVRIAPDQNHTFKNLKKHILDLRIIEEGPVSRLLSYIFQELVELRVGMLALFEQQGYRSAEKLRCSTVAARMVDKCRLHIASWVHHIGECHTMCSDKCFFVKAEKAHLDQHRKRDQSATIESIEEEERQRSMEDSAGRPLNERVNYTKLRHESYVKEHEEKMKQDLGLDQVTEEDMQGLSNSVQQRVKRVKLSNKQRTRLLAKINSYLSNETLFYMAIGLNTNPVESLWALTTISTEGKRLNTVGKGQWRAATLKSAMRTNSGETSVLSVFDSFLCLKRSTTTIKDRLALENTRQYNLMKKNTTMYRTTRATQAARVQCIISMPVTAQTYGVRRILDGVTRLIEEEEGVDKGSGSKTVENVPQEESDRRKKCKLCSFTHNKAEKAYYCYTGSSTAKGLNPRMDAAPVPTNVAPTQGRKRKRDTAHTQHSNSNVPFIGEFLEHLKQMQTQKET